MHLYDTYLDPSSDFEINIDDKLRKSIRERVCNLDRDCFAEVRQVVVSMLERNFAKFRTLPIYRQMSADLGMHLYCSE